MSVVGHSYRLMGYYAQAPVPAPITATTMASAAPRSALFPASTPQSAPLMQTQGYFDASSLLKSIRDEAERLRSTLSSFWSNLTQPPTPSAPRTTPAPGPQPVGGKEAATRIIAEQAYSRNKSSAIQKQYREEAKRQRARARIQPGITIGGGHDKKHRRIREIAASSASEKAISAKGLRKTADGYKGPTLHNPNDATGRFDPHTFQPVWIFDGKEDSFPVRPDYDRSGSLKNDLKVYDHGVIGGKQPLEGAFTVSQRGEYTVMTYSLNYVDNKFTNYHDKDSSTVSIYLKKNAQGKLAPAYVYTSAHYHGTMTPWKDVKKDAGGHPIIRVERGSHALHPYGHKERVPTSGLQIRPNGQATLNGRALPNRMTWLTLQKNIKNVQYLDPGQKANRTVWSRFLGSYPERRVPFHPSLFKR